MNKSNKQQQLLDELTSKFEACNVVKSSNSSSKPACGIKARNLKNSTCSTKTRFFNHLLKNNATTTKKTNNEQVDTAAAEYDVPWDSSRLNPTVLEKLSHQIPLIDCPSSSVSKSVGSQSSSTDDSGIYEPPWDSNILLLHKLSRQQKASCPCEEEDNGSPSFFDILPADSKATVNDQKHLHCCSLCSLDKSPKAIKNEYDDDKSNKSNSSRSSGSLTSTHFDNASQTSTALQMSSDKMMNTSLYIKQHSPERNSDHLFPIANNCSAADDSFQFRRDVALQKLCDEVTLDKNTRFNNNSSTACTRGTLLSTFSRNNNAGALVTVPLIGRSMSTMDKTRRNVPSQTSKEKEDDDDGNFYDVPWEFSSKKSGFLGNNLAAQHKARSHSQSSACCHTGPPDQSFMNNKEKFRIGNHHRPGRQNNGCSVQTSLTIIDREMWYHGNINRQEAELRLEHSANGSYLVRCCETSVDTDHPEYALSLKSPQGYLHMKIQLNEKMKWVLGYYSCPFETISNMISYYTSNKLPVKGAEHICLYQYVPRNQNST